MPDSFMRSKAKELFGVDLPSQGEYAVANVFFSPKNEDAMSQNKARIERLAKERGMRFIGWRPVPVDNSMLGRDPLESEPITEQLFLTNSGKYTKRQFEQELMRIRKVAEEEAAAQYGHESGFYINSLTGQTITYKGQLTPEQVS
jgi:glutamate synthase domain-containing protein 1